METLEIYKFFDENRSHIFYDYDNTKEIQFDTSVDGVKEFLTNSSIESQTKGGKYCIEKRELPFSFFYNIEEFQNEVKENQLLKDCIIHNYKDNVFLFYDSNTHEVTLGNNETVNEKYLFLNAKLYFKILNFFRDKEEPSNNGFEFTDFFNKVGHKIVLSSTSKNGKVILKYPKTGIPKLKGDVDYSKDFEEFLELYDDNKHYPIFLKNSIITNLYKESGKLMEKFIGNLKKINLDAKLNFNVYLHELSLDKIKAEYKEYKQKYYNSQNEILNKISSQVIALPISVAGSLFAIFKLKDSFYGVIIIIGALIFFTIYLAYLVSIYWRDIKWLKDQKDYDFNLLQEQEFFIKNPNELFHFKEINNKLETRIKKLVGGLKMFNGIVWILNIAIIVYSLNILFEFDKSQVLFSFIIGLVAFAVATNYFIFVDKETNKN